MLLLVAGDENLRVQPEQVRVLAQEAPGVDRRGQPVEALVLQVAEVAHADVRRLRGLVQIEPARRTRLTQGLADPGQLPPEPASDPSIVPPAAP
jgi:hypothetical protein